MDCVFPLIGAIFSSNTFEQGVLLMVPDGGRYCCACGRGEGPFRTEVLAHILETTPWEVQISLAIPCRIALGLLHAPVAWRGRILVGL